MKYLNLINHFKCKLNKIDVYNKVAIVMNIIDKLKQYSRNNRLPEGCVSSFLKLITSEIMPLFIVM